MSASARVSPVSFTDPEPVLTSLEEPDLFLAGSPALVTSAAPAAADVDQLLRPLSELEP